LGGLVTKQFLSGEYARFVTQEVLRRARADMDICEKVAPKFGRLLQGFATILADHAIRSELLSFYVDYLIIPTNEALLTASSFNFMGVLQILGQDAFPDMSSGLSALASSKFDAVR
jgi:hypothetical protein